MHVAGAGAGLGHHGCVPAGQLPVAGLAGVWRPARACGTARPRRPPGGSPDAPRPQRPAAAAGPARGRPRPGRCTRRSRSPPGTASARAAPPAPRRASAPGRGRPGTIAPVDGSSSTNSSSTPSVIAPARTAPGGPPGTVVARPAPPDPGMTTTTLAGALASCSGSSRRGLSALARPATAWAAGISGHSKAASVTETAACTATTSAPASVRTCSAAFRVASSGCPAGIGGVRAIAWSFLSFRTRRESPTIRPSPMAPKGAR